MLSFRMYGELILERFVQYASFDLHICSKDLPIALALVLPDTSSISVILISYYASLHDPLFK